MRELHVVATSEDGRHVVLATRKGTAGGEFRVALDERLAAAVRGDLPRVGESEPVVVTPKEIQARLRAGESPEQIAASAGVPVAKIDRYAGPVLSERERVLQQARAGTVSRSRLGESALPLGEAVDRHLSLTTGVRLETVVWSTRREDSGSWLVELSYVSQARRRSAAWRYDMARREVTATDAASAALAHVEPSGRRQRQGEQEGFAPATARPGQSTPRRAAAVRPAAKTRAAGRSPAARTVAAPAARAVAARPTPPVRAAAPVPTAGAPARAAQTAAGKAAAQKVAAQKAEKAQKAAAARVADEAPAGPPTLRVVGSEKAPARRTPKEPPAAARTAPARAAGQRASVPGWADVLLSTAPVARSTEPDVDSD